MRYQPQIVYRGVKVSVRDSLVLRGQSLSSLRRQHTCCVLSEVRHFVVHGT